MGVNNVQQLEENVRYVIKREKEDREEGVGGEKDESSILIINGRWLEEDVDEVASEGGDGDFGTNQGPQED